MVSQSGQPVLEASSPLHRVTADTTYKGRTAEHQNRNNWGPSSSDQIKIQCWNAPAPPIYTPQNQERSQGARSTAIEKGNPPSGMPN